MNKESFTKKFGLEEYVIMVPFTISVILTLISFLVKFANPDSAKVITSLSYYSYAWLCSICVAQCVHYDKHLQICVFDKAFPAAINKLMNLISQLVGFLVVACVFVGSFMLLTAALKNGGMDAKVPQIPLALGYCAPVVGYGMALVRYAMRVVKGGKAE